MVCCLQYVRPCLSSCPEVVIKFLLMVFGTAHLLVDILFQECLSLTQLKCACIHVHACYGCHDQSSFDYSPLPDQKIVVLLWRSYGYQNHPWHSICECCDVFACYYVSTQMGKYKPVFCAKLNCTVLLQCGKDITCHIHRSSNTRNRRRSHRLLPRTSHL